MAVAILNVIVIILTMVGLPLIGCMLVFRIAAWKDYSPIYKKIKPTLKRIMFGKHWREY